MGVAVPADLRYLTCRFTGLALAIAEGLWQWKRQHI
jgi:hypothetical protein